MLGQVLLSQKAEEAQSPGFLQRLCQDPHTGRAPHVIVAADQRTVPLHQPLKVCMLPSREGRLRGSGGEEIMVATYRELMSKMKENWLNKKDV